ncbi:MAG: dipeptide ABC transporter ATP-binding protein [Pseudomonadota bacterium]
MTLLNVNGLSVSIAGTPILKSVSLGLEAGQTLGLVGESGSGKSMTALAVMRLLPRLAVAEGSIRLEGEELMALSEPALCGLRGKDMGMVFQEPMTALNPVRNIGDQVAETVLLHGGSSRAEAAGIARTTLERVGLDADRFPLSRYPHELSGGQRQRVVIAMAIALRPKLLICDEPTTALDVTTQAQVLDLLRRLVREDGMGMIFISHDLAVVAEMADRVAIMRRGEIVEEGETLAFFRAMEHPYSKALLEASTHVPERQPVEAGSEPRLLSVKGLVRDYVLPRRSLFDSRRFFRAVDGVDFAIHRRENLGLVGESGCGKSTLSRAILALEAVQGGQIELDGEPLSGVQGETPAHLRRKIQVVFQDPYGSFNPRHSVGRLVAEPFFLVEPRPTPEEQQIRVRDMLEKVGLSASDAEKFPHEFSGGQRQRIAIARALITEPEIVVLDEAVSALDVSIRAQILDLLASLSDRLNVSYLFISHDLSVVRSITDRVLIMQAGKIVEQGPTQQVFDNPQHPYTAQLLSAMPNLETTLRERERHAAEQ